jgi:MoCo/4Fe-4S cofactor protein with predicted Tat translocation signal
MDSADVPALSAEGGNKGQTNKYWKSLEQWRQDPEFMKMASKEFLSSPLQSEDGKDGWARREFLKLMGASLALTTFGCVRRPAQKIIPYAKKPPEIIHGLPNYYASAYVDGAEGLGLLVTTRDGRPIHIDGNPDFTWNGQGTSPRAIATILKLYDPDRFTSAKKNLLNEKKTNRETISVKWEKLDDAVIAQLKKGGVAVMTSSIFSPSTKALLGDFQAAYGSKTYFYDDISYENVREAQKICYGKDGIPVHDLEKAKVILAINNDFLGTWLTPVRFQKTFGARRKPGKDMNKLIVIEGLMSMTGTNADERFRIKPSQTLDVLLALIKDLLPGSKYASDSRLGYAMSSVPTGEALGLPADALKKIAQQLASNRGQSVVLAGGMSSDGTDGLAIQIAANFLNSILDNDGKTINGSMSLSGGQGSQKAVAELIAGVQSGAIKTVIIHGSNPLYTMPANSGFQEALTKAEMVIYTGDRNDETSKMADYVAVDHHPLENWSDLEMNGAMAIQQPTIQPLYDTRSFQDSLLKWTQGSPKVSGRAKSAKDWHDYLKTNWRESIAANKKSNFEDFWDTLLQTGMFETTAHAGTVRAFNGAALSQIKKTAAPNGAYELSLYPTIGMLDQGLANVPWLQEFPDPVTKICWDNYATFSPADAAQEKIKESQVVELTANGKTIKVPAHIQPGQALGVIGLAVGYGRLGAGQIADGVGVNAYEFANWKDGQTVTSGIRAEVKKTSSMDWLASVQEHHTMEGRQIVVEETLASYIKKPGATIERHSTPTLWSTHAYNGHKWGMSIDLSSCNGCGSCVIACQSENNIPTVGKKNVLTGREMHWIRIDRYYAGDPNEPDVVNQPMLCQHCDNAPCETVCPVIATMHSEEGTNDMIYNRCVGTRYCSNNCPYKVRRFNWFNYTNEIPEPRELALNPEVTVRSRGVMEKCTFCLHRIRQTKVRFKVQDRELKDGDIKTACQTACPSQAIVFGDTNNPESAVSKLLKSENRYQLLEELNTKPAVRYLTKVRNADVLKGQDESFNHTPHKEDSSSMKQEQEEGV